MGTNEEGTLAQLKKHRRELGDPKIKEHRGHIIKTTGDGMLVEFASAVDAVRCAIEIQHGMVKRNADVAPEDRIEFRIGINVGDIIADEGDIFGNGVMKQQTQCARRAGPQSRLSSSATRLESLTQSAHPVRQALTARQAVRMLQSVGSRAFAHIRQRVARRGVRGWGRTVPRSRITRAG
jgi:hypothetical protein